MEAERPRWPGWSGFRRRPSPWRTHRCTASDVKRPAERAHRKGAYLQRGAIEGGQRGKVAITSGIRTTVSAAAILATRLSSRHPATGLAPGPLNFPSRSTLISSLAQMATLSRIRTRFNKPRRPTCCRDALARSHFANRFSRDRETDRRPASSQGHRSARTAILCSPHQRCRPQGRKA